MPAVLQAVAPVEGCELCQDSGWVCEQHPEQPFEHGFAPGRPGTGCPGPGQRCPDMPHPLLNPLLSWP